MSLTPKKDTRKQDRRGKRTTRIAFLGNSMLYFNDCPRLVEQMVEDCEQDSCLRGGATLTTLSIRGNGMQEKFRTPPAAMEGGNTYDIGSPYPQQLLSKTFDYVVINDHTQGPARLESRETSKQALREVYAPLLRDTKTIFIQTMAYRYPNMRGTEDLGDFEEYSNRLKEGVKEYIPCVSNGMVAPVGEAVRYLYQRNPSLWEKLYSHDHFHPSPHGTWLQACVIVCCITNRAPPTYNPLWWDHCRRMQPPDEKPLPLPSDTEASTLREVACMICGIQCTE